MDRFWEHPIYIFIILLMDNLERQLDALTKWKEIKQRLQSKYQKIDSAFKAMDVNESGGIEIEDFEKELKNYHEVEEQKY